MKIKILVSALVFALLAFLTPLASFACILEEDGTSLRCNLRPRSVPSPTRVVSAAVPALAVKIPSGTSPIEAREIPNEWQLMQPRTSIWFKTDYSNNYRLLDYWLETNRADALSFAVYSPQQSDGLGADTKPVGRGTRSKNDPDTIIRWKADYAWPGVWYLLLTNHTDEPVSYKLNHNQEAVPTKACISYWEPLNGSMFLWTDCGRYGPPHP
ncbi:MAG: hypothetical protein HZB51_33875 [Chloroflexi bacterium]|nr:hypothetical protein [Chloroflexota bacterium]